MGSPTLEHQGKVGLERQAIKRLNERVYSMEKSERLAEFSGSVRLELVPCPLCKTSESVSAFVRADQGKVVRCNGCGLLYLNPRPDESSIADFYDESYFSAGGHGSAYHDYVAQQAALVKLGEHSALTAMDLLCKRISPSHKRLLDVGCGDGTLLNLARRRGFEVLGVELSSHMASFVREAYKIDIVEKPLERAGLGDASFDIVTGQEVLEHLTDPVGWLREVRRILKPEGTLLLTTPNAGCAQAYGEQWLGFRMSFEHLTFFDRDRVARALKLAGLRIVSFWTRGKGVVDSWSLQIRYRGLEERLKRRALVWCPSLLPPIARVRQLWEFRKLLAGRERPYGHTLWVLAMKDNG
jgi:2-polyprenyl-3-methyl-5-hydroxy-6-metoxy-1,4-benzoquinol methylase